MKNQKGRKNRIIPFFRHFRSAYRGHCLGKSLRYKGDPSGSTLKGIVSRCAARRRRSMAEDISGRAGFGKGGRGGRVPVNLREGIWEGGHHMGTTYPIRDTKLDQDATQFCM